MASVRVARQSRATALADLIDVIGSKLAGDPLDDETSWSATARARDPAELGALLAAIPTRPALHQRAAGALGRREGARRREVGAEGQLVVRA